MSCRNKGKYFVLDKLVLNETKLCIASNKAGRGKSVCRFTFTITLIFRKCLPVFPSFAIFTLLRIDNQN